MKKRVLSVIIAICMAAAMVPFMPTEVTAAGTCTCPAKCTDSYKDADCPVCNSGGNCESRRNRRIYDDGTGITTQFHLQAALDWKDAAHYLYYFPLDADITVSSNITVPGNADFVLDLNGHTLSGGDKWAIFKVYGKLTIIDTKGGGKLVDAQGAIKIAGGYVLMKGGTIENCTISGGALVQSGGTFKMTGGTLKNNTAYVGFLLNAEEYPASICCDSGGGTVVIDGDAQVLCCDQDNCSHFGAVCKVTTLYADGGKIKGGIYNKFISDSGTVTGTITSHHTGIGEGTVIEGKVLNYGTISAGQYTGEVKNYIPISNDNEILGEGTISGGTFDSTVTNEGSISGGTFNAEVDNQGTVSGGTFNSEVVNQNTGTVSDGTFNSEVVNQGTISGGTFNSEVINQGTVSGGTYSETGVVKNSGTITGGTFLGTVESENGTIEDSAKVSINFVNEAGETIKTVRVLRGQRITSADLPEIDPTQYGYAKVKYTVGNTDYRDEDKFINEIRFTEDETWVTVTRISPIAYTITCVLNNGRPDKTYNYTVTDDDFTLFNPTKDGYIFMGWSRSDQQEDYSMALTVTIPKGSIGNRTYIANYMKDWSGEIIVPSIGYTVVFDTQGGSPVDTKTYNLSISGPTDSDPTKPVLEDVSTTRAGYNLQIWTCGGRPVNLDATVSDLKQHAVNGVITLKARWLAKKTITLSPLPQKYTYDETRKAFEIYDTTLDGFHVTYRQNGHTVEAPVNAGSYDVTVTREEDAVFQAVNGTVPGGLVIRPKEVTVTISEISDQTYTGNDIEPAVVVCYEDDITIADRRIPASEYTVDYANNRNAGTATVTVTDKAGGNYSFESVTGTFTIKQKAINPAVAMADYVYGTYPGYPKVSGNEGGGTVSVYYSTYDDIATNTEHRMLWDVYAIDGATLNAGTYYMVAEVAETQNYTSGISSVISFKVMANQYAAPAVPTLGGSTVTVGEADRGKALEYSLNGGDWVDVPALNNGSFVLSGLADNTGYTLSLRVKADADGNYAASDEVSCFFVAYNANGGTGTVPSGASASSGKSVTVESGDQLRRDGYTFGGWNTAADGSGTAYDAGAAITDGATLYAQWTGNRYTVTFDTDGGTEIASKTTVQWTDAVLDGVSAPTKDGWKFIGWKYGDVTVTPQTAYKDLAADGTVMSIELKAQWEDITAPTGEIGIGENIWKTFLNKITFGLFFKDTQTVTITASDNSGEDVTIEYLLSDKELTVDQLNSATFTAYTKAFSINPDNQYVIYAKLTDTSGNVAYINSEGIVLDATAPVITGVENGKVYCEAQTVTVDEKYIDSVKVNGTAVTLDENNRFTLNPAEGTQTIVATDRAGNVSAEITVTVNDGHTYGTWRSNGAGTHTRYCTVDGCNGYEDGDCDGGEASYFNKAVCDTCHAEYGALLTDSTAPTGEIAVGTNKWNSFLNTITFGLFFKDTQSVAITAADDSYDHDGYTDDKAVKVEYYLYSGDTALTQADLAGKEFTEYNGDFNINPDNKYVVYAKLTDHAGNVTYISSEGVVLDASVPVISGIENGKIYCEAQTVTVDEKYIDSVTVNGTEVPLDENSRFTLSPAEGTQTIVATDKAGNVSAEMIVTVNDGHTYEWQDDNGQYWQKCQYCDGETAKKDIPTITINGADTVCRTQDYQFSFTLPEGTTDAESGYKFTNNGGGIKLTAENGMYSGVLESQFYDENEISFKLKAYAKTTDGFVFSAEKTVAIQNEHAGGVATCIDLAICDTCGEPYGEIDSTNHNLEKISAKDATVTETGNTEYWHCLDCGKYFADENGENEIELADTVIAKLPPEIMEGKGQSVSAGDKKELTFKSNAAFSDFIRVELDGKTFDEKNYTVKEGSTVVTLKADYVAALSAGEHTIGIVSESGTATATFTVSEKTAEDDDTNPPTGDISHMALWIALLFVSGCLLTVTVIKAFETDRKRRNKHE